MWGDAGWYRADVGQIWGSCGALWGDVEWYGVMWGGCGALWGDVGQLWGREPHVVVL